MLFNALAIMLKDAHGLQAQLQTSGLLGGFTGAAYAVVLCNACNGLAISAVLKYADNIARVYAHAIAMIVTMLACVHLFHAPVTPQLVIAIVLVACSTLQYNMPQRWLAPEVAASGSEELKLISHGGTSSGSSSETEYGKKSPPPEDA